MKICVKKKRCFLMDENVIITRKCKGFMRIREEKRDRSLKVHLDKIVKVEEKVNVKLNV